MTLKTLFLIPPVPSLALLPRNKLVLVPSFSWNASSSWTESTTHFKFKSESWYKQLCNAQKRIKGVPVPYLSDKNNHLVWKLETYPKSQSSSLLMSHLPLITPYSTPFLPFSIPTTNVRDWKLILSLLDYCESHLFSIMLAWLLYLLSNLPWG